MRALTRCAMSGVEDKKKYDVVKAKLDNYFVKRRNIINE